MKNLLSVNSILVLIIYFFLNPELTFSQVQTDSFIFEGVLRDYIVFLPQNYNDVDKLPLVFNLHGGSLNAQQQLDYSKMNEVADTAGFIVVYPNAVLTAWSCGINLTAGHVNDVGFIDALLDTLANNYSIDEERIYCCGFSLGGFMSHRLACQLSNRIAAIADVAGSIAQDFTTNITTAHPMPVLKFHGTADQIIPYDGKNDYCSVEQTLSHWANFNHCNLPDTTLLFNIDTLDGCTVQKINYKFKQNSGEVVHYKVLNGGHTWPGGDKAYFTYLSVGTIGNITMDINASELIWNFFQNYRLSNLNSVKDGKQNPSTFCLFQNYPNPFNPITTIKYQLPAKVKSETANVKLIVFDILGREVTTLINQKQKPGNYEVTWDATDVPSGVYFYKLSAGDPESSWGQVFVEVKKMILLK